MRRFAGAALLVVILAVVSWMQWPRHIDVEVGVLQTTYYARAGRYAVTMTLSREQSRDHGPAVLRMVTSAGEVVVSTSYNHDTLQDEPAGTWHLGWVDGDLWPDVIIETNRRDPAKFVVRSSDGVIREMPAR